MAKKRKKIKKQSLLKNTFLFLTSLCMFIGATLMFYNVIHLPGLPFDLKEAKSIFSLPQFNAANKDSAKNKEEESKDTVQSSTNDLDYSFYDILYHKGHSPSDESHYCIQLGAFDSHERAQSLVSELKEKRLQCTIRKKGGLYLVQWGNFSTVSSAERYRKKFSNETGKPCIVAKM